MRLSQAAKAYHPGRGVYRSSYKNARRLAATETNIAYRTADHLRWQQLDFVVGIRVVLSNNHTLNGKPFHDICDDLSAPVGSTATKGRGCYPKDFKFTGWHPLCRCHAESILKTEEEFVEDTERILQGEEPTANSVNTVSDVPQQFKNWLRDNRERIDRAKSLPYFIRDNRKVVDDILGAVATKKPLLSPLVKLAMGIGVEVGKPMSHEAANLMHGNPHYKEDAIYRVNCQSAVVAYEMRRRGLDVEAFGNIKGGDYMPYLLSKQTNAAWLADDGDLPGFIVSKSAVIGGTVDKWGRVRRKYTSNDEVWADFMDKTKEPGRYHLSWKWKGAKNGHIITMETFKDGKRRFYDPQCGLNSENIIPWFFKGKTIQADLKAGIYAYRVDTLRPNTDVIRGVVKKSGSKATTPIADSVQKRILTGKSLNETTSGEIWNEVYNLRKTLLKEVNFKRYDEVAFSNLKGVLKRTGKSRKNVIKHLYSRDEFSAAQYAWDNPSALKYKGVSKLGAVKDLSKEKDIKNIKKKENRGVVQYNIYEFKYNGHLWKIKTEVYKDGKEEFYSIVK